MCICSCGWLCCLYLCVYTYVHVCQIAYIFTNLMQHTFLSLHTLLFDNGSCLNLEFNNLGRVTGQQVFRIFLFLPMLFWDDRHMPPHLVLCMRSREMNLELRICTVSILFMGPSPQTKWNSLNAIWLSDLQRKIIATLPHWLLVIRLEIFSSNGLRTLCYSFEKNMCTAEILCYFNLFFLCHYNPDFDQFIAPGLNWF